jgi:sugar/nucleoside kinase (ribokinase family)
VKLNLREDSLEETQRFLKNEKEELNVVVMPDLFLDRIVELDFDEKAFCRSIDAVTRRKGGSIDRIRQIDLRGGNAVNTASALAALGVKVTPIVCTSKLGLQLIRLYLQPSKLDLSHVKIFEKASITTAIEFRADKEKANLMLRDVGSLADFGPSNLNEEDLEAVENADYVCVFNWAGTKRFGTELVKTVFHNVKTRGKGKTYYDTADPTPNAKKIPELVKSVLQERFLNILSVNENEAVCYAEELIDEVRTNEKSLPLEDLAKKSAEILASRLSARVELHTTSFSATFTRKGETIVPAFKVPVLRVTGAGDAWNAGNILGDASRLSDEGRLTLANAVAAYYISSPDGKHPTRKQLARFCEKLKYRTTA